MRSKYLVTPEDPRKLLGFATGVHLPMNNRELGKEHNALRRRQNHVRNVVQHLEAFYSNNSPGMEVNNSCPKFVNNKMRNGKVKHTSGRIYNFDFIIVYIKENTLNISPLSGNVNYQNVITANVLGKMRNNKFKDSDILNIYHVNVPKPPEMPWAEWRRVASDNILIDGGLTFRSIQYYQLIGQ